MDLCRMRGVGVLFKVVTEHFPPRRDLASPQSPALLWAPVDAPAGVPGPGGLRSLGAPGLRSGLSCVLLLLGSRGGDALWAGGRRPGWTLL